MSRAWMPLYVADYLADTGHLSAAEHGAYLLLIMHYWQNGRVPNDDRCLARIARMSPVEWDESRDFILEFFLEERGLLRPIVEWADIHKGSVGRTRPADWQEIRLRIFARDGFVCTYCGSSDDLQCDHIFPVARGGSHDDSNLTTACRTCNASKGAKTVEEWRS